MGSYFEISQFLLSSGFLHDLFMGRKLMLELRSVWDVAQFDCAFYSHLRDADGIY